MATSAKKNPMVSDKRIIRWRWGNNKKRNEYMTTRAFVFGNYSDSATAYLSLIEEAKRDFPYIKNEDITLGKVSDNDYMKGYIVISFLLPNGRRKKSYRLWERFDFRY